MNATISAFELQQLIVSGSVSLIDVLLPEQRKAGSGLKRRVLKVEF